MTTPAPDPALETAIAHLRGRARDFYATADADDREARDHADLAASCQRRAADHRRTGDALALAAHQLVELDRASSTTTIAEPAMTALAAHDPDERAQDYEQKD